MFLSDVDLYYLKNEVGVDVSDTASIELCTRFTDLTLMPENEKEQHVEFETLEVMTGRAFILQGLAKSAFEGTTLKTFKDLLGRQYCVYFDSSRYFEKFKVTPRPSTLFNHKS